MSRVFGDFLGTEKEKKMFRAIMFLVGVAVLSVLFPATKAQHPVSTSVCPTIKVECISDNCCHSPYEFVVHVNGTRQSDKPVYQWSVSSGTIISGQGSTSIKVDSTGFAGQAVTATVEIAGVEPDCPNSASMTQTICDPPISRRFDQYGSITWSEEREHLDSFAAELQGNPHAQGYLIVYNDNLKRAERSKNYLVNQCKMDKGRIVIVEGGKRTDATVELYIVPLGANPPTANPPT